MDFYFTVNPSTYRSCEELGLKRVYIPYRLFKDIPIGEIAKEFKEKPSIFVGTGKSVGDDSKININIREYSEYIKKNADVIDFYTSIDVEDPKERSANLAWLQGVGLSAIPTWHAASPIDELEDMCKKHEYIFISGAKFGVRKNVTEKLCKKIFPIITKHGTKVHANMAFIDLLREYPFYSVSTSSWTFGSRFGLVYSFDKKKRFISRHWKEDKKFIHMVIIGAKEAGIVLDEEAFRKGDGNEIDEWNFYAWKRVAQELEHKEDSYNKRKSSEIKNYFEDKDIDMKYEEKDLDMKKGSPLHPAFIKHMGTIEERRENSVMEKKRLAAHKKAFKDNLFAFKDGSRSTKLPLYCNNCYVKKRCRWSPFNPNSELHNAELGTAKNSPRIYCAMRKEFTSFFKPENFALRDKESVDEMKGRLMSVQMTRAAMNYYYELLDGGIQDRSLTGLISWIYERLDQSPNVEINLQKNVLHQTAKEIRNQFTKKQKDLLLDALRIKGVKEAEVIEKKDVKSKEKKEKDRAKADK